MIKTFLKYYLLLPAFLSAIFSCDNTGSTPDEKKLPAIIRLSTKELLSSDNEEAIKTIRFIAFSRGDGTVVANRFSGYMDTLRIQVMSGTYDFVVIANENPLNEGQELPVLSSLASFAKLEEVTLPSTILNTPSIAIPMYGRVDNVKVVPHPVDYRMDGSVSVAGSALRSQLNVPLDRVVCKLEVTLQTRNPLLAFNGVAFSKLASEIYFVPGKMAANRTYERVLQASEFEMTTPPSGAMGWAMKGMTSILLPETQFAPPSDKNQAPLITLIDGTDRINGRLGHEAPSDYTLWRNMGYRLTANLYNEEVIVEAEVLDWSELTLDLGGYEPNPMTP